MCKSALPWTWRLLRGRGLAASARDVNRAEPEINAWGQPVGRALGAWTPPAWPQTVPQEGAHVRLEPIQPARHAAPLHAALAQGDAARFWTYLPYGPFAIGADYRAWLESAAQGRDPVFYAVTERDTGDPVGLAAYLRIDPKAASIEVGHLQFSPRLQRRVAATEAMYLMMAHAFALGYRRYEWKCDALNAPSRAAALRLGFHYEGTFRQATVVKGRNRDTAWFSILDGEWPALRQAFERWLAPANFDASGQQRERLSVLTSAAMAPLRA